MERKAFGGGDTGGGGEVWDSCLLCGLQQGKWVTGFYNVYVVYLVVYYVAPLPPLQVTRKGHITFPGLWIPLHICSMCC